MQLARGYSWAASIWNTWRGIFARRFLIKNSGAGIHPSVFLQSTYPPFYRSRTRNQCLNASKNTSRYENTEKEEVECRDEGNNFPMRLYIYIFIVGIFEYRSIRRLQPRSCSINIASS